MVVIYTGRLNKVLLIKASETSLNAYNILFLVLLIILLFHLNIDAAYKSDLGVCQKGEFMLICFLATIIIIIEYSVPYYLQWNIVLTMGLKLPYVFRVESQRAFKITHTIIHTIHKDISARWSNIYCSSIRSIDS